jgi:tetratricopeptide (TPR) repeat protein
LRADAAWHDVARVAGRWIRKEPSHLCVLEYLLEAEWRLGRFERVVTTATQLIAINPKEPCYHLLKGVALFSLNRPGAAMPSLRRALQLAQPGPLQTHIEHYTELTNAWQGVILAELMERNPALRAEFERAPEATCLRVGLDFAVVAAAREQSCGNSEFRYPAQLA